MFTRTRIALTMLVVVFVHAGESAPAANSSGGSAFILKSPAIGADGLLPQEFTGDGSGITPPLEWSGAPAGTKGYALIMSHLDPEGKIKWYWTLYQIPAAVTHLEKKSQDVGIAGLNSINDRTGYAPPHSKGPGLKYYVLTLYALSDLPKFTVPNGSVTGAILSATIKDCTLSTAVLKVGYDRAGKKDSSESRPDPREGAPAERSPTDPSSSPSLAAPSDDLRADKAPRPTTTGSIQDTAIKKDGTSADGKRVPEQARSFLPYVGKISLGFDKDYLYVRSDSLPDHRMMVGITAWQQQVPIPQSYVGDNAWRIPLKPVVAKKPLSAKDNFFRGAIALAANGVPIFNPIKNDGKTDTLIAGELDEFGGHCGRADDYHYHTAPLHLQKTIGADKPIAYALDGYPIFGLNEIDGTVAKNLDAFNGHADASGNYHYHATKTYPYLNGGFHGEVNERGGQVDPQPSATPIREAGAPLRGAIITDFVSENAKKFALTYRVNGQSRTLRYSIETNGTYKFVMPLADGTTKTEEYQRIQRGGGQGEGRPPRPDEPPAPTSRSEHSPVVGVIVQADRTGDGRDGNDRAGDAKPDNKNLIKPTMADTIKVNVYADNWFVMYINGTLRAVDSIEFTPHNVVSVDILPEYPMTIAVMAKDNADPKTGLEYGDRIGDGGISIKFADGTLSNATWKAKSFFKGPLNHDTKNPKVEYQLIPERWWAIDFDDHAWAQAVEFTEERVKPKDPYYKADFKGAKFIWSEDLSLNNTVIFRTKIDKPGWNPRWNTKPDLDVSAAPLR